MENVRRAAVIAVTLACAGALVWTLAPAITPPVRAQQAPRPQRPAPEEPATTIRVDVDVVNVLFTVKDRKGKLVNTLTKDDFEVYEEGQKQQIRYFSRETALPLTVGLLVDTSVSQYRLVEAEREAAEVFLRRVLGQKDLAFLISFDTNVDLLQDMTGDVSFLRRGLGRLRANAPMVPRVRVPTTPGPFPTTPRGTLFYDAVYLAAREKLASEVGRKAIVVITDGEDQGSRLKLDEAVETAQRSDVIIYGILFFDRYFENYYFGGYSGDSALKKMSEETGGRMIRVDRDRDLAAAFEEISQELRSQYSIGYVSSDTRADGRFRKLRIKTRQDDLKVQARKGYYKTGEVKSEE